MPTIFKGPPICPLPAGRLDSKPRKGSAFGSDLAFLGQKGSAPDHLIQHLTENIHIFRFKMPALFHLMKIQYVHRGISENFHPVGREQKGIGVFLPFENNVLGLLHNHMMPIQAQAEILSGLAQAGDIRQGEKESLTVFFLRAAAGLGDPAAGAVFTQYPVFAGKDAPFFPCGMAGS